MKKRALTLQQRRRFLIAIPVPDGFTVAFGEVRDDFRSAGRHPVTYPVAAFTGDGITMRLVMDGDGQYMHGSGHTTFTTARGERSYDRLGVEDSFYAYASATPEQVGAKLLEQIARVAKSREYVLSSVLVPGLGYSVTPERKAKCIADLKAGRSISFTPSGFGTGYRLSVRQAREEGDP
jgi:hypothetical protein